MDFDNTLELQDLSKSYGKELAVNALNLKIPSSKITAFLGPNGAGKTTTIKMLVGLLKPSQGKVLVGGKDFSSSPEMFKRSMAYIPDFPFLYDRLTGREFLEFVLGMAKISEGDGKERIQESLALFRLEDLQHRLIKHYSHGMRQRLVFCSALIRSPKILIIDEPMVGLDPKTARIFKDTLLTWAHERGATIFLSTHQLSVACELADKIVIIHQGKICAEGSLSELLEQSESKTSLEEYFLSMTETF